MQELQTGRDSEADANILTSWVQSHGFCCLSDHHERKGFSHVCVECIPDNSPLIGANETRYPWTLLPWEKCEHKNIKPHKSHGLVEPETRPSVDGNRSKPTPPVSTGNGGQEQTMPTLFPSHQGPNPQCKMNCTHCVTKAKANSLTPALNTVNRCILDEGHKGQCDCGITHFKRRRKMQISGHVLSATHLSILR